jgi:proline racemase
MEQTVQPLRVFHAVDSHTAGATTRIVTAGSPRLKGKTMWEKMRDFQENYDHIRRALMLEPRGSENMSGAFLTEPTLPEAELGVIFTHANGYHSMCGHGAIGVACAAVETGLVPFAEPTTNVILETPAGLVPLRVDINHGQVSRATFQNVPCFLRTKEVKVALSGGRTLEVDLAYGGVPVIIAEAEAAGLTVGLGTIDAAIRLAAVIREQVAKQVRPRHPESGDPMIVDIVMFNGPATVPHASFKDIVVSSPRQVDRSPCGAGTCARMAQLHARGMLDVGEEYVQEGILGTLFSGRLVDCVNIGGHQAVIPEVTGRAHIVGFNQWIIDADDPLHEGFAL